MASKPTNKTPPSVYFSMGSESSILDAAPVVQANCGVVQYRKSSRTICKDTIYLRMRAFAQDVESVAGCPGSALSLSGLQRGNGSYRYVNGGMVTNICVVACRRSFGYAPKGGTWAVASRVAREWMPASTWPTSPLASLFGSTYHNYFASSKAVGAFRSDERNLFAMLSLAHLYNESSMKRIVLKFANKMPCQHLVAAMNRWLDHRILAVIRALDSRWLQAIVDECNSLHVWRGAADWVMENSDDRLACEVAAEIAEIIVQAGIAIV
jgi:hypothetical protein